MAAMQGSLTNQAIVSLVAFMCVFVAMFFSTEGVITGCPTLRGARVYTAWPLSHHCGSHASVIAMATYRNTVCIQAV